MIGEQMTAICTDDRRRYKVREQSGMWNGLDYLEVLDPLHLRVYFLNKAPKEDLHETNIVIKGGRRIQNLRIEKVIMCRQDDLEIDDCMTIKLFDTGDLSTYTLCVVKDENGRPSDAPFPGFDPRYACLDFTFQVLCPSDLDCKQALVCPPAIYPDPEIDYLAKDYASFRQLILDRLALIIPGWQESHVPDIGVALVEMLAYVGDYLSYYQDSVATEAYLDTARQRISVRRHARLVDYAMHEGCNARAWVHLHVEAGSGQPIAADKILFITGLNDVLPVTGQVLTWRDLQGIPSSQYEVFEPLLPEPEFMRFSLADFKDATCLVTKLAHDQDPLSRFLRAQFPQHLQRLLNDYVAPAPPSIMLQLALVEALNRLLEYENLYDEKRFAHVTLEEALRRSSSSVRRGSDLVQYNRALLERAYPYILARRRRPDEPLRFYAEQNELHFYTWGDRQCCLPRGACSATLQDSWQDPLPNSQGAHTPEQQQTSQRQKSMKHHASPTVICERLRALRELQPGDVLVFEEICGPLTGETADADPTHRHIVRLTDVTFNVDALYDQPVVEIAWSTDDALPFPLCISAITRDCTLRENISVARGNMLLVDHGSMLTDQQGCIAHEPLGCVPMQTIAQRCVDEGWLAPPDKTAGRFRPVLQRSPITFSQPLVACASAAQVIVQDPHAARPAITVASTYDPTCETQTNIMFTPVPEHEELPVTLWAPQRDLAASKSQDAHFVAEIDNDGRAHLRFGDGELGRAPEVGMRFSASYRVGNGLAGNVGAESISHLVARETLSGMILRPRNPLPARGGIAAEPLEDVKLYAPYAFRQHMERAVTADDYAAIVMRDFPTEVQRAVATLRWSGSWYEVLVAVDAKGKAEADQSLLDRIQQHLRRYHRIGHDVVVRSAQMAALDIEMRICVLPNYLRGHVKAALLARFGSTLSPSGEPGFFHPDNLTFGEGVYLSQLVAAAQAVPGVASVAVTKLERLYAGSAGELDVGVLLLGPLEVARLDNDPSLPENGCIKFYMGGGR